MYLFLCIDAAARKTFLAMNHFDPGRLPTSVHPPNHQKLFQKRSVNKTVEDESPHGPHLSPKPACTTAATPFCFLTIHILAPLIKFAFLHVRPA